MAWNEPGGGNGNQHDPWSGGGRRGGNGGGGNRGGDNQGPPDLDEALKKFQDKLNGMLGGRGGKRGGGKGGGKGGGNRPRNTFALPGLLIIIGLAVWAASGFYLVDQSERGVVLRFGKFQEVVTPGLQWNPPLIDDVRMVNVTRVRSVSQTQSMLTQDENIVSVEISAQYQVAAPRDYVLNVRDPELSLENALDSALRHVVGGTDMIDILTSGREILGSAVTSRLQTYLDNYGTGIRLVTLNVESTSPPDAVQDAFDDVIRAREDRQRTINQAMAYANAIIPAAQGQAQRIVEQGQGYRESVVAEARGQANRFTALLTQYRNAPEVMRERLYLDAISEVLGQTNKVLVDVDQDGPLMVLPMDRIGRGLGTSTAADAENQLDPQVLERIRAESANAASNSSSNRNGRDTGIQREGR
ncbi:FtsH protease activity modulator HflK [Halomonas litopenaei]|jgi:membrane protease subunit HflK|uniref:Protein HflK n=1 Tax=Halomonas litopenaei TaxID=2109328 RepID=A0ABX5J0T5_9GAMM|nr:MULTISPECIES: FtsH protease activity modulator HflK [Halomonas]MBR9881426.1 FtsH protease activity modulator HflK [Gammaproteobacteria bacterium]MAR71657.1 FtsH protease activity modulator HflK [Halomonas sp.]MBS8267981.1 FtsH protease activity modulator HflK [Halomonas litopenaei]PTL92672.1 FtsH protease activity modulator HflK [Halomonas sp. SYSU XM8]PTL96424.1 FtsH protease activity modulator HflK [Halomonas litopenaei]